MLYHDPDGEKLSPVVLADVLVEPGSPADKRSTLPGLGRTVQSIFMVRALHGVWGGSWHQTRRNVHDLGWQVSA